MASWNDSEKMFNLINTPLTPEWSIYLWILIDLLYFHYKIHPMNILNFEIWEDDRVNVFINDENLIEILREYELPFSDKEIRKGELAGSYWWIYKDTLLENLQSKKDKVYILGCKCGEEMCWPMRVTITEEDNKIIWSNFEQPYRDKNSKIFWDYTNFGSFTFDKENYQSELKKLES